MSKPRLTKEQKRIRKQLVKYHRNLNKDQRKYARRVGIGAIAIALLIQHLIKGKD